NHTDAGGIVYHSNYITFCEQARSEYFFKHKIFFENEGYMVKELKAKYIKPAKLGDIITIHTYIKEVKKASLTLFQKITKENTDIFEMEITVVFIKNGKISKIPENHLRIINELKNKR
ncbi:MAG: thioesterase family protein, partial [Nautiliaceae bacterium]